MKLTDYHFSLWKNCCIIKDILVLNCRKCPWPHQWVWLSENFYINQIRVIQIIFLLNIRFGGKILVLLFSTCIFELQLACLICNLYILFVKFQLVTHSFFYLKWATRNSQLSYSNSQLACYEFTCFFNMQD